MLDVYYRLSTVSSDSSSFCPANVHSVQSYKRNRHELIALAGGYTCVWCAREFHTNCLVHGTRCRICEQRPR